jgi:hypothetical protein
MSRDGPDRHDIYVARALATPSGHLGFANADRPDRTPGQCFPNSRASSDRPDPFQNCVDCCDQAIQQTTDQPGGMSDRKGTNDAAFAHLPQSIER